MLKQDLPNITNCIKFFRFLLVTLLLNGIVTAQKLPTINFSISDSSLLLIDGYQKKAVKEGLIAASSKKWMDIIINDSLGSYAAKARIKGDWLDHIENDKKSFRIKIKDSTRLINGVKVFSIQDPKTRSYLKEWLLHKVLADENILTTQYDFVSVKINEQEKGTYAFEQHFDKYLLESQQRREAPILKLDEAGFWQVMKYNQTEKNKIVQEYYALDIANVKPFKKNKTTKDSLLHLQFDKASKLVSEFRYLNPLVIDLMDKEKYAKLFALTDVFQNYHSLNWINLRFYLNPLSGKIEPVVYDGYTTSEPVKWNSTPIMGYIDVEHDTIYNLPQGIFAQFFNDSTFQFQYYDYLKKYSKKGFLDNVFSKYDGEIDLLEKEIIREVPNYKFNKKRCYTQAEKVKSVLEFNQNLIEPKNSFVYYSMWRLRGEQPDLKNQFPLVDTLLLSKMALKAQYVNDSLYLINSHSKNIKINNYMSMDSIMIDAKGLTIDNYNPAKGPLIIALNIPNIKYINYTSSNNKYSCKVTKKVRIPYRNSTNLNEDNYLNYFKLNQQQQLIPKQKVITINSPIILPEGYPLSLPKGTQFNLKEKGSLIIQGDFVANGTVSDSIIIKGTTRENGIIVSHSKRTEVKINYVSFSMLGSVSTVNYTATGGVTFYNTDCNINNCTFKNSLGEDMLNIVKSTSVITNSTFTNAFSDALDIDYGKGKILNCSFSSSLNDNIDISNALYFIENVSSIKAKDKAISCGEQSKVTITKSNISKSTSGLVVKDKSNVVILNSTIKKCITAVKVFQKKVLFGGGKLSLTNVTYAKNKLNEYKDEQSLIINR